jgi:hypothetical protein
VAHHTLVFTDAYGMVLPVLQALCRIQILRIYCPVLLIVILKLQIISLLQIQLHLHPKLNVENGGVHDIGDLSKLHPRMKLEALPLKKLHYALNPGLSVQPHFFMLARRLSVQHSSGVT